MGDVIELPDRGKDEREQARENEGIGQMVIEGAESGDLRSYRRYLLRIGAAPELIDEAGKAGYRQDELIKEIEAQHGEELGLVASTPENFNECRKWLLDHVENLRTRSSLFEEYYWLVFKLDFKKAEEVRQRGLRVVR